MDVCKKYDEVMFALLDGSVCKSCDQLCKRNPNCERINFGLGFLYPAIRNNLPRNLQYCRECNSNIAKITAKGYNNRGELVYLITCKCGNEYTIKVHEYNRKHVGGTNMRGEYIPPAKSMQSSLPKYIEERHNQNMENMRLELGLAEKVIEKKLVFVKGAWVMKEVEVIKKRY